VFGLRESAMLLIEGNQMDLKGPNGGKLFRKGMDPIVFPPGSDLSFMLQD
jgi:hypothetical protein